jgi:hypothetical protein
MSFCFLIFDINFQIDGINTIEWVSLFAVLR